MWTVCAIIAGSGAAGGLANYLMLPPEDDQTRNVWDAARMMTIGAIVAFAVPLFLSMAQSGLIAGIIQPSEGKTKGADVLVLVGFCIVASFASRAFMQGLVNRLLAKVERLESKQTNTQETVEEALDNIVLAPSELSSLPEVETHESSSSLPQLAPIEERVLRSAAKLQYRTIGGLAKDLDLSKVVVRSVTDDLVKKGVLAHTASPNTGGPRVSLTSLGVRAIREQPGEAVFRYSTGDK